MEARGNRFDLALLKGARTRFNAFLPLARIRARTLQSALAGPTSTLMAGGPPPPTRKPHIHIKRGGIVLIVLSHTRS